MFIRTWLFIAAFGIVLVVISALAWASWDIFSTYKQGHADERNNATQYETSASEQGPESCGVVMHEIGVFGWLACLAESVSVDGGVKQAEYDLKAQQDMAAWAFGMLIVTVWLSVITLVGVLFVGWTLRETRRAVKAADDAVKVTRDMGEAQTRAYLHAEFVKIGTEAFSGEDGSNIKFVAEIQVINSGATPAYGVEVFYDIRESQSAGVQHFNLLESGQMEPQKVSFIPAKKSQATELKRTWESQNPAGLLRGGKSHIRLIWAFKFTDEFGKQRETPITSGTFHEYKGKLCFFPDRLETPSDERKS